MNIKLFQLISAFGDNGSGPLNKLAMQPMPASSAFKIKRVIASLSKELEAYTESKNDLVKKYGEESDDGNIGVRPDNEHWSEFQKEFVDLVNQEIEINIPLLKPEDLVGDISAQDLIILDFIFEPEPEPNTAPAKKPTKRGRRVRRQDNSN